MLVPDVNVLLHGYFEDSASFEVARSWLDSSLFGNELVATPDVVLSGYIRISTNASLFANAPSMAEAIAFARRFHIPPNGIQLQPGPGHWGIFETLLDTPGLSSRDVSDAYLAAFALENDATFVTFDRGFRRFADLKLHVLE